MDTRLGFLPRVQRPSGNSGSKAVDGVKERTTLEVDTPAAHVVEGDAQDPDRRITNRGKGWREEALAP